MGEWSANVYDRLSRPVDGASLAVFRMVFGVVMLISGVRFWARGWIDELYLQPTFHFKYWGFAFVEVPPAPVLYAVFVLMCVSAAMVAVGLFYRAAALAFFLTFTYVELLDKTTYLNHYYFVSLMSLLMAFLPLGKVWSFDERRRAKVESGRTQTVPLWALITVRVQLGLVYFFAGIAKLNWDWLVEAQPLTIWLAHESGRAVIGTFLSWQPLAFIMSWCGAIFDLTVPFGLAFKQSRALAYACVVVFHVATGWLFNIGMFPWIMIASTLVFFHPSWPRRWLEAWGKAEPPTVKVDSLLPVSSELAWSKRVGFFLLAVFVAFQVVMPLRQFLYPGPARWTEEGFRYGWNVMVMEKTGLVDFRVKDPATGQEWKVSPRAELTDFQAKMMATQPDMVLEYAHHLEDRFRSEKGLDHVEVRADAYAALNGRESQRLIDPEVDLARERDTLAPKTWIVPLEED